MYRLTTFFLLTIALLHAQNSAPNTPRLSAREVFYEVADDSSSHAAQAGDSAAKPKPATPVKPRKPKPKPKPAVAQDSGSSTPGESAPAKNTESLIVPVSDRMYPPLGLKYSIFRISDDGQFSTVEPGSVFHSRDHIQLVAEVNSPGYLYVISRGSSGKWSLIFPQQADTSAESYVAPGQKYFIPGGKGRITFADPAGEEKLFVYLSRQPIRNAEDLMLQLSGQRQTGPVSSPSPAAKPKYTEETSVQAWNHIDDNAVAALEHLYSRDLIVETAPSAPTHPTSDSPTPPEGDSVYLVDKSGKPDAHVVADLVLQHE